MNSENIISSLISFNPWWDGKSIPQQYDFPFERPVLEEIRGFEKIGRVVVIKGPRRTGKTTLLYQYIKGLIKSGVDPKAILFTSMDDLNLRVPLKKIIEAYLLATGQDSPPAKFYLFLDEIQFLENWSTMIKVLADQSQGLKIIVSGSSASLIAKGGESLAGRTIEKLILPFSISETIGAQERGQSQIHSWLKSSKPLKIADLKFKPEALRFKNKLLKYTSHYLEFGGFPHLFGIQDEVLWKDLLRTDIIQKAIYKDLADLYGIRNPLILEKLFLYLIESTAGIINLSSVSIQLKIARETLNQYLAYLKNAFLVIALPKYSRYPKEILKSQEKIHIIDPGFTKLVAQPNKNQVLESTTTALVLHRNQELYYWRQNYETDLVVKEDNNLIPIEVKNTARKLTISDVRGLVNFMERYQSEIGIIIYQGDPEEIKVGGSTIRLLPSWYALPMI